jgi:hypothetical protein
MGFLEKNKKIFEKYAGNKEQIIYGINEIEDVLVEIIKETKGSVVVDFMDRGNYDRVHSVKVIDSCLYIVWDDHSKKEDSFKKSQMGYPYVKNSLMLKFKDAKVSMDYNFPVIALRGHSLKNKEAQSLLGKYGIVDKDDNFKIENFQTMYGLEIAKGEKEYCLVQDTPLYSVLLIPKGCGLTTIQTKKYLYHLNLAEQMNRLFKASDKLNELEDHEEDEITEKMNTARKVFEALLKLDICIKKAYFFKGIKDNDKFIFKSDYQDMMSGKSIKQLKPYKSKEELEFFTKIVKEVNEFSHDSGVPVTVEHAQRIVFDIATYGNQIYNQLMGRNYFEIPE